MFDLYQMMSFSDHEAVTSSLTFWRSLNGMGENKIEILSEMEAAPPHTRCLCSAVHISLNGYSASKVWHIIDFGSFRLCKSGQDLVAQLDT